MSHNTNYTVTNSNYGTSVDLSQIFPPYEVASYIVSNSNSHVTNTIPLVNNTTSTNNYQVLANYTYTTPYGGNGIFNWQDASNAAESLLIFNKTNTSFDFGFSKDSSHFWDGGISFLIIYYTSNNYYTQI
jgi:hypothetical protein